MDHADRSHLVATEHYREAREFAKWSSQDRAEKRAQLPPLTAEQEKQMKAYLRMMQGTGDGIVDFRGMCVC
jgi:hypothetical protein